MDRYKYNCVILHIDLLKNSAAGTYSYGEGLIKSKD